MTGVKIICAHTLDNLESLINEFIIDRERILKIMDIKYCVTGPWTISNTTPWSAMIIFEKL